MNQSQILAGKRVLFVLCGLELGGAERQALYLAKYLKGIGCAVRIWGHNGPGLVIEHCKGAGIPWAMYFFRWPCRKLSLGRVGLGFLKFFLALRREPADVIIAYTGWANVSTGLAWRWSKAKVCIWGQRDVDCLRGDAVERFAYRRASAVICNAEHEIEYLRRTLGETPAPVFVVHNGLELGPCLKSRADWRRELGLADGAVAVTMLANFRPEKDHQTLLQAWHRVVSTIPDSQLRPRLLLAGALQESYPAALQLAKDLGILESVSFLGQVQDVSGLLAASDIGVLTSTGVEGTPNAIIEYMASGLPVVATDLLGNRETLSNDPRQPFCKIGDAESLTAQLRILLHDPQLRQRLGAQNQQRSAAEFSIETMCKATVGIIGDLLQKERLKSE